MYMCVCEVCIYRYEYIWLCIYIYACTCICICMHKKHKQLNTIQTTNTCKLKSHLISIIRPYAEHVHKKSKSYL